MSKVKKILDIKNEHIQYINNAPIAIKTYKIICTPVHSHSQSIELIFCLEGNVTIVCNHEVIELNKAELFLINPNDIHCIYSNTDNLIISMYIDLAHLLIPFEKIKYSYFSCEDNKHEFLKEIPLGHIKNILLSTTFNYIKYDNLESDTATKNADAIVSILLKYFDWYNVSSSYPYYSDELLQRMQKIVWYCEHHYSEKLTMSKLSQMVHVNENYLSQFLHKSPYGGFSKMIGYIRCYTAQKLLLSTDMSILQISQMCGFSNDKYFYRYFKYWWKKTPNQYRSWFKEYIRMPNNEIDILHSEVYESLQAFLAEYYNSILTSEAISFSKL